MRIAGGLLVALASIILIFTAANYQPDNQYYVYRDQVQTAVMIGVGLLIVGILLCLKKPRNKNKEELEKQALQQQIQLQQEQLRQLQQQSEQNSSKEE